jgi:hypothetical protein
VGPSPLRLTNAGAVSEVGDHRPGAALRAAAYKPGPLVDAPRRVVGLDAEADRAVAGLGDGGLQRLDQRRGQSAAAVVGLDGDRELGNIVGDVSVAAV